MAGFHPNQSKVGADTLAEFLAAPIQEDISSVPGIGPAAVKKLSVPVEGDQAVTTTHQLIGKFLTLKSAGISQQEHFDAMWHWLKLRGIDSHRSGIIVSLAEKLNVMIPGFYSAEDFVTETPAKAE